MPFESTNHVVLWPNNNNVRIHTIYKHTHDSHSPSLWEKIKIISNASTVLPIFQSSLFFSTKIFLFGSWCHCLCICWKYHLIFVERKRIFFFFYYHHLLCVVCCFVSAKRICQCENAITMWNWKIIVISLAAHSSCRFFIVMQFVRFCVFPLKWSEHFDSTSILRCVSFYIYACFSFLAVSCLWRLEQEIIKSLFAKKYNKFDVFVRA